MQPSVLQKYGEARLPRYTSYPPSPEFSPTVGFATYGDWLSRLPPDDPASLYLHVPFCRSMCWYCGCHTTITAKDQPVVEYLDLLRREIDLVAARAPQPLRVDKIHFGGGTPTIVAPMDFVALMDLLRDRFGFTATAEIAIEIDPRTLTIEMAGALGGAGVGRASLGVQSFDPVVQRAVNRIQSEETTIEAVDRLRQSGVGNINFDLIYGLPHQTVRSCIDTASSAAAMRPDRFAVFGYAHVPSFKKHQRMIEEAALPDSAARMEQALAIAKALVAAGYVQIGLDHFALPDDELAQAQAAGKLRRNFQGYTTDTCETLIGFGASAIGRTRQGYVQNQVGLGFYSGSISDGQLATARGYRLTAEDRLRAEIIERLMCDFEVDVPAACARHGFDAAELITGNQKLRELAEDGVIDLVGAVIRVRRDHRFLVRAAAAAFDAYLYKSGRSHSQAA
ncbi:MAG: oxygen-independent coproporphyrinogen III oxidase [Mesorhizobium sp.]|nr:oxygen-independent coproporphyrinogen III oxidase [Mesorhizobium sp.]MBN9244650.1 oxygen-independent coproporphyrinogen III oxidase [Mesorhizobium sp.]